MKRFCSILSLLFVLFAVSCDDVDPVDEKAPVATGEVSDIKVVSAVFAGSLNIDTTNGADFKFGFVCSENNAPDIDNSTIYESKALKGNDFTATISDLDPDKKYYCRAYVHTGGVYHYGDVKTFTTKPLAAGLVVTGDVVENSYSSAKVSGSVKVSDIGLADFLVYVACSPEDPKDDKAPCIQAELAEDNTFEVVIPKENPKEGNKYCTLVMYRGDSTQGGAGKTSDYKRLYGEVRGIERHEMAPSDVFESIQVEDVDYTYATITVKYKDLDAMPSLVSKGVAWSKDPDFTLESASVVDNSLTGVDGEFRIMYLATGTKHYCRAFVKDEDDNVCFSETVEFETLHYDVTTCAEVIAGPDGETYRIQGICTRIIDTQYGNWYLNDGTGEVYIYGTVNYKGFYNWPSYDIEVGDEVVVEGPKSTYNGVTELVDVTVVGVIKSLVKVEPREVSIDKNGGEIELNVVYHGEELSIEPQCDWISLGRISGSAENTVVVLNVDANNDNARIGKISLKSANASRTSEAVITVTQTGVMGSLTNPFTVAQAIDFALANGGTTADDFYIKGKVSKVLYPYRANYGTGTFWISDDGEFHGSDSGRSTDDMAHDFECYSTWWFNNQPWVDGNAQLSVGDEVIICGKLTVYNGLAETATKASYVYSVNGLSDDSEGLGSLDYPLTAKGAIAAANAIGGTSEACYYIKGICSKILYTFSANYGTGSFWISNDGEFHGAENGKSTDDKGHDFECYNVYWFDNQPWTEGNDQVEVGDEVTVYGQITLYNGTAETATQKAYVYSINKR